ncbi:MAG: DUF6325 family protein [Anaerolineales bacterium]|jgi:hypothetical protein
MDIGPLEYVVIGVSDRQLKSALISELNAIQEAGKIRVVDLIFVSKSADGAVAMQEVSELVEEELAEYGDIALNLMGLLTAEDINQLTGQIPPDSSAVVILIEHTWVIGLTEAVRKNGGAVYAAGMVSHDVLAHVSAELAAGKEGKNA